MSAGGMPLADQPGMAQGFGDLTAHDFLRVAVDVPGVRVLNIDPPVLTVDDFLTHDECDALVDAARASGEMKVSAVGGAENVNIRTSRTCTLNSPKLTDHPTKRAILAAAERLLPDLRGLAASKHAFKVPTSGSPFSYELPQVAHYSGGEYFKTHEDAFPPDVAERKGYQRRATVLVYLNDVAEGGATRFDKMNIDVAPVKGKALLFFPGTKASAPDARTLHTATEATVGHEKWISQLWVCGFAGKHAPEGKPPGPGDRAARRAAEKAAKGGEEGGRWGKKGEEVRTEAARNKSPATSKLQFQRSMRTDESSNHGLTDENTSTSTSTSYIAPWDARRPLTPTTPRAYESVSRRPSRASRCHRAGVGRHLRADRGSRVPEPGRPVAGRGCCARDGRSRVPIRA